MVRMRAIENHRWILRATNTGVTAAIDPYGRVTAAAPRHIRTSIRVRFGYEHDLTFYTPLRRSLRLRLRLRHHALLSRFSLQAAQRIARKLESMLSDLEYSYSPVRDKVRDLREYL